MSQKLAIRLVPEPVRSLSYTSIGSSYMGIGTQIVNPIRILRIQNLTDAILYFSFDGINDHEVLAANSFLLLDITANKAAANGCFLAEGTRVYAKELGTPTEGSVYVTVYYGEIE